MEQSANRRHQHRIIGIRHDGSRLVILHGIEREAAESLHRDLMEMDSEFLWFEIEEEEL